MIYKLCQLIVHLLYRFLFRYEALGMEHIPDTGAVLLCSNHLSNWDPPFVALPLKRRVRFMAKEELFKVPVLRQIIRYFGAFPVKRGASDKGAIRTALSILRNGQVMVIFPEGTRSKTGQLGEAYTGSGFLALKEPCTVIPVAIIGPYRLFHKVKIVYGPPIQLDDLRQSKANREAARLATERIMDGIRMLLEQKGPNSPLQRGRSLGNGV